MRSEFVKRLHARFNKEGIEFAFPTRTVYMADSE
jgi:small-conductance mechanosensitive channel